MGPDDDICYCYHVPLRKLQSFVRREKPARASQLSECLGAGTGCGWCIPILKRIHALCQDGDPGCESVVDMTPQEYAAARDQYRKSGGSKNQF